MNKNMYRVRDYIFLVITVHLLMLLAAAVSGEEETEDMTD